MAQPKRRWSKARTALRRSTWKLKQKSLATCENCKEPILSHRVCPSCGKYNKRQVLEIKEKTDKKSENK